MEYYLIIRHKLLCTHNWVDLKYIEVNEVHIPQSLLHVVVFHVYDTPEKGKRKKKKKNFRDRQQVSDCQGMNVGNRISTKKTRGNFLRMIKLFYIFIREMVI